MAIIGSETPGGTSQVQQPDVLHTLCTITVVETVSVTTADIYLRAGNDGDAFAMVGIYDDDNGGNPGTRMGTSGERTLRNFSAAWTSFTFTPAVELTAGTYWLALATGGQSWTIYTYYDAAASWSTVFKSNDYDVAGMPDPFGAMSPDTMVIPSHVHTYDAPGFTGLTVTRVLNG